MILSFTFGLKEKQFMETKITNNISQNTIKNYDLGLRNIGNWLREKLNKDTLDTGDITTLTEQDINEFKTYMMKKGKSVGYINNMLMSLSAFIKYLIARGEMNLNVIKASGQLKESNDRNCITRAEKITFLELEEAKKLLKTSKNYRPNDIKIKKRNDLIMALFLTCGLRSSELSGLTIEDFDFQKNRVTVFGKGRKYRQVGVRDEVMEMLKDWLEIRGTMKIDVHNRIVFLSKKKSNLSNVQLNRIVKDYCKSANIEKNITCHKLRHSFATILLSSQVATIEQLRDLLGHESIETTMIYTHAIESNKDVSKNIPLFD